MLHLYLPPVSGRVSDIHFRTNGLLRICAICCWSSAQPSRGLPSLGTIGDMTSADCLGLSLCRSDARTPKFECSCVTNGADRGLS